MKKILLLLASFAVLFTACSEKEGGNEGGEPDPVEATLTVTPATLEFAEEGETLAFKVTTNVAWTVTTNADWLDLSAGSGNAGENLEVEATAEANETEEERSAVITVKAGDLSKAVTVTQGFVEPEVPTVDPNTTYELVSAAPLVKASELVNGKLYVVYNNHFNTKCWKEVNGQLSMTENTEASYSPAEVFEFVEEETGMVTDFTYQGAFYYGDWSAGYWKSLSTGKYISKEFGFTTSLEDAFHFQYANNWGCQNAANELNVFDVYAFPVSEEAGAVNNTIWYTEKTDVDTFHLATNEYQNTGSVPTSMRKWVVYEVAVVE